MMLWHYVAGGVALFALGSYTGWEVRDWKAAADNADRVEREAQDAFRRAEIIDRSSEKFEVGRASAEARERVVEREVIRVVEKPVYRERCLDDDGLRILTNDIAASNARREFAPAVPPASSPR